MPTLHVLYLQAQSSKHNSPFLTPSYNQMPKQFSKCYVRAPCSIIEIFRAWFMYVWDRYVGVGRPFPWISSSSGYWQTQTCRSEAHITKHQCLTSKAAMQTERQLIQVNGLGENYTKEAKPSVSTAHSSLRASCLQRPHSSNVFVCWCKTFKLSRICIDFYYETVKRKVI